MLYENLSKLHLLTGSFDAAGHEDHNFTNARHTSLCRTHFRNYQILQQSHRKLSAIPPKNLITSDNNTNYTPLLSWWRTRIKSCWSMQLLLADSRRVMKRGKWGKRLFGCAVTSDWLSPCNILWLKCQQLALSWSPISNVLAEAGRRSTGCGRAGLFEVLGLFSVAP
jgi:hypothetical protein